MGVSGVGKTSLGKALSDELGWAFYDADDFHSEESRNKMKNAQALNDSDRLPWLRRINKAMISALDSQHCLLACSALKKSYRQLLLKDIEDWLIIYLWGDYELIGERLDARKGHFMKSDLLQSQYDVLEPPEHAIEINAAKTPTEQINQAIIEIKRTII